MSDLLLHHHFVLPGQVLATSHSETDGGFLRGHGTYIELVPDVNDDDDDYDDDDDDGRAHPKHGGGMAGTRKRSSTRWGDDDSNTTNLVMRAADDDNNNNSGDNDDTNNNDDDNNPEHINLTKGPQRLIASVAGTVERVNKLISVIPLSPSIYVGQVGDLVIGRIVGVGGSRWKVSLTCSSPSSAGANGSMKEGQLPLSGVNLPGGVQRIRTSEDALAMRSLYKGGIC
jgi:hypothetical protein